MFEYNGIPNNLTTKVIGKVTLQSKALHKRKDYIFVTDKEYSLSWKDRIGYCAIISSAKQNKQPSILISNKDIKKLHDNDILLLESDGKIVKLWDATSQHNALFVTETCNCHCMMCPQPPITELEDNIEQNMRILDLIDSSNAEYIGITGGEPTLTGDNLVKIVAKCAEKFPTCSATILTNARKLSNIDNARAIVKVGHKDLLFGIPIYSDNYHLHDKIVGSRGAFDEAILGIKNLALFRQKIEIRIVVHALTFDRLPQLAEFIYRNMPFVVHIAFMGMELKGLAEKNIDKLWIDPVDYADSLVSAVKHLQQREMNVSVFNLPLCVVPSTIHSICQQSISDWKNNFLPVCEGCTKIQECSGFFTTSKKIISEHIKPII